MGKGLGMLFMFRLVGSAFRVQAQLGLVALLHALGKLFPPNNLVQTSPESRQSAPVLWGGILAVLNRGSTLGKQCAHVPESRQYL